MSVNSAVEPRVLFISRKFPPSVGGMERLSHDLITSMSKKLDCRVIAWGYSQKYLPFFLVVAFFRSALLLATGRYDLVHVGDALLAPLGVILGKISGRPVAVNLHGLDMTYPNRFYQWMMRTFLPRLDLFICISRNTRDIALGMKVPPEKTSVIPCGIRVDERKNNRSETEARRVLESLVGRKVNGMKIAVTVGRLVKRKGVRNFVGEVLPLIVREFPGILYLVVGKGEEEEEIRRTIAEKGMADHAVLLGKISADELEAVYGSSDVFVMPNIPVKNDVEGFGIVALEASLAGLAVVATNLEGISDAIVDGRNGILVDPGESERFAEAVIDILKDDRKRLELSDGGRRFTETEYSWDRVSDMYHQAFLTLTSRVERRCCDREGV